MNRSRHGKTTFNHDKPRTTRPHKRGMWAVKGTYAAEESGKEQFVARVTSRDEALTTNLTSQDIERESP